MIKVSTGLPSHLEAWPGKNASLLIQVVGRIYFLEAACLRAQLLLGADCLSKSVDSQSTDLVHSSLPCGLLNVDTYFSKPARRLSHYIIMGMTFLCSVGQEQVAGHVCIPREEMTQRHEEQEAGSLGSFESLPTMLRYLIPTLVFLPFSPHVHHVCAKVSGDIK